MMRAPIALAMDTDDLDVVAAWTRAVSPSVTTIKIGLECYLRHGSAVVDVVREMAPGIGIFLDLKLHDIPNTVGGAAAAVRGLRPEFLTVHALGGMRMVAAAAASLRAAPSARRFFLLQKSRWC